MKLNNTGDPAVLRLIAMVSEVKCVVQSSDVDVLTRKVRRVLRLPSTVEVEAFVDRLNSGK